jgi:hypothetical protein
MRRKERKDPFPPEADTEPDLRRPLPPRGERLRRPAPREERAPSEVPTLPPPAPPAPSATVNPSATVKDGHARSGSDDRASGVRRRRRGDPDMPAATVDEVTADLSKDPRRERDD